MKIKKIIIIKQKQYNQYDEDLFLLIFLYCILSLLFLLNIFLESIDLLYMYIYFEYKYKIIED